MLKKAMFAVVVSGLLFAAQGALAMSAVSPAFEGTLQAQPDRTESPFPVETPE